MKRYFEITVKIIGQIIFGEIAQTMSFKCNFIIFFPAF